MHLSPLPPASLFSCLHSFLLTAPVGFDFPPNGLNTHFALLCSLPAGLAPCSSSRSNSPQVRTPPGLLLLGVSREHVALETSSLPGRVRHPRQHPCSDATRGLQTLLVPSASPSPASPPGIPDGHALPVFRYPSHGNSGFQSKKGDFLGSTVSSQSPEVTKLGTPGKSLESEGRRFARRRQKLPHSSPCTARSVRTRTHIVQQPQD